MEPRRDDTEVVEALRSLRPEPCPEFAAELDARAAAGFPRSRRRPRRSRRGELSGLDGFGERLRSASPRRLLAPVGACALAAIVVATAVISTSDTTTDPSPSTSGGVAGSAGSESTGRAGTGEPASQPSSQYSGAADPLSSGQAAKEAPGSGSAGGSLLNGPTQAVDQTGPYASRAGRRQIERSAQIVLGAAPDEVRSAAAEVFDAVDAVDGIVLRSTVRDGAPGDAGAEFELLVPSGKLGDALAAFSAIGEVRSRREATQDITAPTIGARERLRDSRARIEGLLAQLAEAATEDERTAVERQLRGERRHAAYLRSRLSSLERRASFSRVSLSIETGGASGGEGEGGAWGIADGLDSAGRVLAVAAGVTAIVLAVLGPIAALGLLLWLANRAWLRRRRDHALS